MVTVTGQVREVAESPTNLLFQLGFRIGNLIEQDHRAIKRRCASMAGFKSFDNAAITLAGIELAHRIRKNQFSFGRGRRHRGWSRKAEWAMALA